MAKHMPYQNFQNSTRIRNNFAQLVPYPYLDDWATNTDTTRESYIDPLPRGRYSTEDGQITDSQVWNLLNCVRFQIAHSDSQSQVLATWQDDDWQASPVGGKL